MNHLNKIYLDNNKIGVMVWNQYVFDFDANDYNIAFDEVLNPNSIYQGSMLGCLYTQLYQQNLHDNVTIVAGLTKNIASLIDYHLIWSDAAHDKDEINRNSLSWKKIAKNSLKNHNVFCFHDVGNDKTLIELINNIFSEYEIVRAYSLVRIYIIELSLKTSEIQIDIS